MNLCLQLLTRPGDIVAIESPAFYGCLQAIEALRLRAIEIHRLALDQGFSVAPGPLFSAKRQFRHCLRLNCGHAWSPAFDAAIRKLGAILRSAPRTAA